MTLSKEQVIELAKEVNAIEVDLLRQGHPVQEVGRLATAEWNARKQRERAAAQKAKEAPPLVRIASPDGRIAVYPEMKPDGKGGWMFVDPEFVASILKGDSLNPPKET